MYCREVRTFLNDLYLEYVNNYLTVNTMAEHQRVNKNDLKILIDLGRAINNNEYIVK